MDMQSVSAELEHRKERRNATGLVGRMLVRKLAAFDRGRIVFELPDGQVAASPGLRSGVTAHISVHRWRALFRLLVEGDVGLAAGWIDGDWTTEDLPAVLAFGLENADALSESLSGSRIAIIADRLRHGLRRNSRRGSKRNIAAHYDLGNDFYRHWLDNGMQYSSALYTGADDGLAEAQQRKLERIAEMMALGGGEEVLEVGCGWGAVAEHLAAKHGCQVTGITLSKEQATFARQRLASAGHAGRTEIELRDYRAVEGTYDRIVSIEMFEAVGEAYWPVYFDALARALRPEGNAVLQVITIDEKYFDHYRRRPDFIQKYIFPGGMLPSKTRLYDEAEKAGFSIAEKHLFGESYAQTLDAWRHAFEKNWREIQRLGFDEQFRRMWEYYLHYCAMGFRYGSIDVGLYKLVRR
ncbi:MAG: class I SAM-dependent methyltransferase [Beijerinckiaceae bacterium]